MTSHHLFSGLHWNLPKACCCLHRRVFWNKHFFEVVVEAFPLIQSCGFAEFVVVVVEDLLHKVNVAKWLWNSMNKCLYLCLNYIRMFGCYFISPADSSTTDSSTIPLYENDISPLWQFPHRLYNHLCKSNKTMLN